MINTSTVFKEEEAEMSYLYLSEKGIKVTSEQGQIVATLKDGMRKSIPIEMIDGVIANNGAAFTSDAMISLLENGIPLIYMSHRGKFYGKLQSTNHVNIIRQRMQFRLGEDETFCMEFSKKIIEAKINNQIVLVKRYNKNINDDSIAENAYKMSIMRGKIEGAKTINEILGIEGIVAKLYFESLSKFVPKEFEFKGRNRMPPKDEFNSMISYGYTLLLYEIYAALETRGLSAYAGFMHKDRQGHPALASDIIEEWRAPIVDSLVLNMIHRAQIQKSCFKRGENSGIYLNNEGNRLFVKAFETKLAVEVNYFEGSRVSFRRGIDIQVMKLVRAIEVGNIDAYEPLKIR